MTIKATILEVVMDNYQGGSGVPITRQVLIELQDWHKAIDIEGITNQAIEEEALNSIWGEGRQMAKSFRILKIEILLTLS